MRNQKNLARSSQLLTKPLQFRRDPSLLCGSRRARSTSRSKPRRATQARASANGPVGRVDESATAPAGFSFQERSAQPVRLRAPRRPAPVPRRRTLRRGRGPRPLVPLVVEEAERPVRDRAREPGRPLLRRAARSDGSSCRRCRPRRSPARGRRSARRSQGWRTAARRAAAVSVITGSPFRRTAYEAIVPSSVAALPRQVEAGRGEPRGDGRRRRRPHVGDQPEPAGHERLDLVRPVRVARVPGQLAASSGPPTSAG